MRAPEPPSRGRYFATAASTASASSVCTCSDAYDSPVSRRASRSSSRSSGTVRRRARPEELVALGFSGRKAEYVLGLAQEPLDLGELAALPDEEVKRRLVSLRGLGEWTADWFLARHLARPRAWPAGDLALRKAVVAFYPEAGDIRAFGERFEPFQNLTAHYLLTGLRVAPP